MARNSFLSLLKKTMASNRITTATISRQYTCGDADRIFKLVDFDQVSHNLKIMELAASKVIYFLMVPRLMLC